MSDVALAWYGFLNSLYVTVSQPFGGLTSGSGSLVTALMLGLLGALSPCQLSTNASSIAYLIGGAGRTGRSVVPPAAAYVAGKVLVYSAAGLAAFLLGQGLQTVAIPTVAVTRKVLGPLMILIGLAMLGVWRPRVAFGHGLSARLRARTGSGGTLSAFLLGIAFSFAFCPTLALLFFGYVLPMAVASTAGPLYPAAFAAGTTFPLILTALVVAAGSDTGSLESRVMGWEPWLRRIGGIVFLLAGLNDTLLYWFL
ncbi:MAG: urease accessory protein UreH domain-containing protein [Armatimonadota bacterium]